MLQPRITNFSHGKLKYMICKKEGSGYAILPYHAALMLTMEEDAIYSISSMQRLTTSGETVGYQIDDGEYYTLITGMKIASQPSLLENRITLNKNTLKGMISTSLMKLSVTKLLKISVRVYKILLDTIKFGLEVPNETDIFNEINPELLIYETSNVDRFKYKRVLLDRLMVYTIFYILKDLAFSDVLEVNDVLLDLMDRYFDRLQSIIDNDYVIIKSTGSTSNTSDVFAVINDYYYRMLKYLSYGTEVQGSPANMVSKTLILPRNTKISIFTYRGKGNSNLVIELISDITALANQIKFECGSLLCDSRYKFRDLSSLIDSLLPDMVNYQKISKTISNTDNVSLGCLIETCISLKTEATDDIERYILEKIQYSLQALSRSRINTCDYGIQSGSKLLTVNDYITNNPALGLMKVSYNDFREIQTLNTHASRPSIIYDVDAFSRTMIHQVWSVSIERLIWNISYVKKYISTVKDILDKYIRYDVYCDGIIAKVNLQVDYKGLRDLVKASLCYDDFLTGCKTVRDYNLSNEQLMSDTNPAVVNIRKTLISSIFGLKHASLDYEDEVKIGLTTLSELSSFKYNALGILRCICQDIETITTLLHIINGMPQVMGVMDYNKVSQYLSARANLVTHTGLYDGRQFTSGEFPDYISSRVNNSIDLYTQVYNEILQDYNKFKLPTVKVIDTMSALANRINNNRYKEGFISCELSVGNQDILNYMNTVLRKYKISDVSLYDCFDYTIGEEHTGSITNANWCDNNAWLSQVASPLLVPGYLGLRFQIPFSIFVTLDAKYNQCDATYIDFYPNSQEPLTVTEAERLIQITNNKVNHTTFGGKL